MLHVSRFTVKEKKKNAYYISEFRKPHGQITTIKLRYLQRCGKCKTGLSHTCTHGWQDEKALKSGVLRGLSFPSSDHLH